MSKRRLRREVDRMIERFRVEFIPEHFIDEQITPHTLGAIRHHYSNYDEVIAGRLLPYERYIKFRQHVDGAIRDKIRQLRKERRSEEHTSELQSPTNLV